MLKCIHDYKPVHEENIPLSMTFFSLANFLTFFRILAIPFIVSFFYIDEPVSYLGAGGLFMIACLTDGLDGYAARTLKTTSRFGQLLDPIADKLLISTTLLMLAGFDYLSHSALIPAVIILCREILIAGLREMLSLDQTPLPVNRVAKWKTAIQMISLSALLFSPTGITSLQIIGVSGLWISALITAHTGFQYFYATRKQWFSSH